MDKNNFQSPFSFRYGSPAMREIFSEENKYKIWRRIWVALAEAEHSSGLLTDEELSDLKAHQDSIDIDRIQEIEKYTKHDVVAAIREYAEKTKIGGGKIHLGATSMDIRNNQDMIQITQSLEIIENKLKDILKAFSVKIDKYADLTCIGYTHLQPAEPTTVGYRMAFYAQDLLIDLELLQFVKKTIKAKGIKGAVGTSASYKNLGVVPQELEKKVLDKLGLRGVLIATQIYTHKYDYLVLACLASIASTLSKFASDLRILQSPAYGEWSEPFGDKQVGSSAMPFKRNPIDSEKICSLARYIAALPQVTLGNLAHGYLERTLDDSANKRIVIPEAFLGVDEILMVGQKIIEGLVVNETRIKENLQKYAPFAATEAIIISAVGAGADRQTMHEVIREISMVAWETIQKGGGNPMTDLLKKNDEIAKYVEMDSLDKLMNVADHIGDAPERARQLVEEIKKVVND